MGGWYRSNFTGHRSKAWMCVRVFLADSPNGNSCVFLKDDGYLIVVTPATDHLYAMLRHCLNRLILTPQKFC